MSENPHSLPPEIKGKAHGKLKIVIGSLIWLDPSLSAESLNFRIKFWGEKGPGVILKSKSSPNSAIKNEVEYTIRCTQPIFISYLMDMNTLTVDVTDSAWRLLGSIKINVKLYLKKDFNACKGNLASNFGFSNIDVEGIFPILLGNDPPKKIGEVDLVVFSSFGEVFAKVSKETEADLPVKPNSNEKYAENSKIEDKRIANSLSNVGPGPYNPAKIVSFKDESKEIQGILKPVPPKALKKHGADIEELVKEDLKNETNMSMELENLRQKGERLRKKLEASSKNDVLQEILPQEPVKIEENPLPTLSELQALTFPHDPTENLNKKGNTDKAFSELSEITHLKLGISTFTIFSYKKDLSPVIECVIPLPNTEGTRSDSFKISQKYNSEENFIFNHESLHHIVITDGIFSKLASNFIKFKVLANEKGKIAEIGKAEIQWEKIIISQGFSFRGEIDVYQEENKGKKSVLKIIGKLNLNLSLINEKNPISEVKPIEVKKEETRSFLLYLYLDHIIKLEVPGLNLFITYKTFPDPERISTEIYWNYKNSQPIFHKLVTAVLGTSSISSRLSSNSLIIELWNKLFNNSEELIGIVKLPLQLFASYVNSGDTFVNSIYPIIAFDEYRPITNIKNGEEIGLFKVCLAMGSASQVNKLRQNHETQEKNLQKFESEVTKLEKKAEEEKKIEVKTEIEEKILTKPENCEEKEFERSEILTQSIESIGDIAAMLNQKNKSYPEAEVAKSSEFVAKFEVQKPSSPIYQERVLRPVELVPEKSMQEIVEWIQNTLQSEAINLEEELKIADRFNYGYMHSESLAYFFQELRIGLSAPEIKKFIENIIENKASSTHRRVLFTDVLSALNLIQPLYTKHTFTLTVNSLFACQILTKISQNSVFLKYQFPTESNFIETDLLEPASSIPINLKSIHSCTFPKNSALSSYFSDKIEGICIFLCQYGNKNEEKVIGKGILPIEEVIELENEKKLNRVICLYGDFNEELQIHRNDLIGKVRVMIEYSTDYSYQNINASGELLYEKHTEINRKIPRNNALSITLESFSDVSRGIKYLKNAGIEVQSSSNLIFNFSVFYESKSLSSTYPSLLLQKGQVKDSDSVNISQYIDLNMNQEMLDYLNHNSGLLSLYIDSELIGTCKVPLLSLLIHSNVKGEYAILNEYGQFMGLINLNLAFTANEVPKNVTVPFKSNTSQIKFDVLIESAVNVKCSLNEVPNLYVNFQWVNGVSYSTNPILRSSCPSWNKNFSLAMENDEKLIEKPLVFQVFHKSNRGDTKIGEAIIELNLILVVKKIDGWYHVMQNNQQVGQLKVRITCDEEFHQKFSKNIKEEVFYRLPSPQIIEKSVAISEKIENKFEERLKKYGETLELEQDDDILSRHYENMKSIENLAKNLELRLSGKNTSPLRSAPLVRVKEISPYNRFVPITAYSGENLNFEEKGRKNSPVRHSHPLKKSRESSPETYKFDQNYENFREISRNLPENVPNYRESYEKSNFRNENAFPLRKSRENSPKKFENFELPIENRENFEKRFDLSERFQHDYLNNLQKSRESTPPKYYKYENPAEKFEGNDIYKSNHFSEDIFKNSENFGNKFSPKRDFERPVQDLRPNYFENVSEHREIEHIEKYQYKEIMPNYEKNEETYDEWDSDKIADVLKTIEEAGKIGEEEKFEEINEDNPYEHYTNPYEKIENVYGKFENPYEKSHHSEEKFKISPKKIKNFENEYNYDEPFNQKPEIYKEFEHNPARFSGDRLENYEEFIPIHSHRPEIPQKGIKSQKSDQMSFGKHEESYQIPEKKESFSKNSEKSDSSLEKFSKKRASPKISKSALPKSLLSDPEISRIAAIMKGTH